jgi:type I restriction enzyme S subunit
MKSPAGWHSTLLHHVAEVRSGLSKNSNRESPTVRKPYLRVANVQDGFLDLSEIKEIDVPENQVARFTLQAGDLLLIEGNGNPENLGRGCIWDGQIPDCVHQNHVFAVRMLPNAELLPEFLALQLQSDHGRNYLLSCAKGSTGLSTLNTAQLKEFPLVIPIVIEQRRIVNLMSAWDTAIEKTERLIASKEISKRGLMQRLVMGRSFPEFRLSEFVHRVTRKNTAGNGHPLTISGQDGLISQSHYFDKRIAAEITEHYTLLTRGEFAYNKSYSTGYPYGAIKRLDAYDEGIVSSLYLCFALNPDATLVSDYLIHFCEVGGFNHQIHMVAQEGARNHGLLNVAANDFFAMKLPVPPLEEQSRVVSILDNTARELALLRKALDQLSKQKRGLMQKLLTGQWRVSVKGNEVAQ